MTRYVQAKKLSDSYLHRWSVSYDGIKSGVALNFVTKYGPQVATFHCLAHRLELAVHDALKSVNATSHFKIFLFTLHSFFSQES